MISRRQFIKGAAGATTLVMASLLIPGVFRYPKDVTVITEQDIIDAHAKFGKSPAFQELYREEFERGFRQSESFMRQAVKLEPGAVDWVDPDKLNKAFDQMIVDPPMWPIGDG